jgi:protein-disulfide isomerase
MNRDRSWFGLAAVIGQGVPLAALLALGAAGYVYFIHSPTPAGRAAPQIPKEPISFEGDVLGATSAPLGMMVFSDFQCPYCGTFARETLPSLEQEFVSTGRVAIVFRQFPLSIHELAHPAAELGACASAVGSFWNLHDLLFQRQKDLSRELLLQLGGPSGVPGLDGCDREAASASVGRDIAIGVGLGVASTPSVFIGTRAGGRLNVLHVIVGARPKKDFAAAIERASAVAIRSRKEP